MDWSEVEGLIRKAEHGGGTVGVTITPPSGAPFVHRGDRQFRAASTVKIPIMIEIYRQVDHDQRSLEDRYVLRDEDRAVGRGSYCTSIVALSSP
jgi:beta-lactamase class A